MLSLLTADVVKSIDVLEQGICHLLTRLPFVAPDEFRFDGFEESLDHRVIPTIPLEARP